MALIHSYPCNQVPKMGGHGCLAHALTRCILPVSGLRRQIEQDEGMVRLVPDIQGSDTGAAGLLIECRGQSPEALEVRVAFRVPCRVCVRASLMCTRHALLSAGCCLRE